MKKLVIIHGTMGVGKTTVCQELYKHLENAVWLDGDWCWLMHPLVVSEENKKMVLDNIKYVLRNYLKNSSFEYVIFNWVIHQEEIFDAILEGLQDFQFELYKITLLCSEDALVKRMLAGGRDKDCIERSVQRLDLYKTMDTIKIDTTYLGILDIVAKIRRLIQQESQWR